MIEIYGGNFKRCNQRSNQEKRGNRYEWTINAKASTDENEKIEKIQIKFILNSQTKEGEEI